MTEEPRPAPPDAVPGDTAQPSNRPLDASAVTTPLEDAEGDEHQIGQTNVGFENEMGGGEWPDPDTPPTGPSPGAAGIDPAADRPGGARPVASNTEDGGLEEEIDPPAGFKQALEEDPERGGSATTP